MPHHVAEKAITDWRSAAAVAKALNVDVIYIEDHELARNLKATEPNTRAQFGFERRKGIELQLLCSCAGCRKVSPQEFAEYDKQREHIFKPQQTSQCADT